ncbi:MAG: gamma-glutamyl-gamma-aminobutyrate hydrolase family protein [Pseudomonadota bacterium]
MPRPLIGVIGNYVEIDDRYPIQGGGMHNLEAVTRLTDAMPVIVPAVPEMSALDDLLEHFHGFVFTGGRPNVHPEEYGEEATEAHGAFDRNRDAVTLPLIRACVERAIPILGICRGFQEFNVAFGGSLHPEIRDLPGRDNHRMPPDGTIEEKFALRHDVTLIDGSVFRDIFGSAVVKTNSLHGQGIKEPGARISIEGYAPDGTAEAIRILNAPGFALAVQWHPEYKADEDPVSRPLFEAFGKAVHERPALAA